MPAAGSATEGLLVRMAPLPPLPPTPPVRPEDAVPEGLVDALRESAHHAGGRALAATDGGSIGDDFYHRRGSVGIAVRQADGAIRGFSLPRPGLDQTSHGAEFWGLWIITVALANAAVPADVWIDNSSVVHGGRRAWKEQHLPRRQPAAWHSIREQARKLVDCKLYWCPSHGKRPDWNCPAGFCALEIRDLNAEADDQAKGQQKRM